MAKCRYKDLCFFYGGAAITALLDLPLWVVLLSAGFAAIGTFYLAKRERAINIIKETKYLVALK